MNLGPVERAMTGTITLRKRGQRASVLLDPQVPAWTRELVLEVSLEFSDTSIQYSSRMLFPRGS